MKSYPLPLLCLLLLASCNRATQDVTPASPKVIPNPLTAISIPHATVVYYDISGGTEIELRDQLDLLGPIGYEGYQGDSTTQWFIRWNWDGYGSQECDLKTAKVSYDIQVIMPRWIPPRHAPPDLISKWGHYIRLLARHETGHVEYVVSHYPSVIEAIQKATCETAEEAAQAMLAQIRQHDIDYDAATNHGTIQGARFP